MVQRGQDGPTAKQKKGTRFRNIQAGSRQTDFIDCGLWGMDYGSLLAVGGILGEEETGL